MTTTPKINLQSHTGHPALNSQAHQLFLVSLLFCLGFLDVLWLCFGFWFFGGFFVCLAGFGFCVWFFSSDIASILGVVSLVLPYLFHFSLATVAASAFNKTFYFGQLLWPNATTAPATNAKLLNTS